MPVQELQNATVKVVGRLEYSELKTDELGDQQLPAFERFKPVSKFGQVIWFYRRADFEAGNPGIEVDHARVIAVIE